MRPICLHLTFIYLQVVLKSEILQDTRNTAYLCNIELLQVAREFLPYVLHFTPAKSYSHSRSLTMAAVKDVVGEIQYEWADRELHWLTSQIITPEFPQIIETLEMCSNLLLYNSPEHPDPSRRIERGPPIKLPLSSTKLEALKGIIVRDGAYVTQLQVQFREHTFNKLINRLHLREPILLDQILQAKKSIDAAIACIKDLSKFTECSHAVHSQLVSTFHTLLQHIQEAKNNLQLPTDPNLVFPVNVTSAQAFEPELPPTISLDLYISQAEVCIDVKSLHRVTEKPWSEIESTSGMSYIDKLRDEMKLPLSHSSLSPMAITPVAPLPAPLNMADIEDRLNELTTKDSIKDGVGSKSGAGTSSGLFSSVLSHLRHKHEPVEYITKCITFNKMVVMVKKKIEVSSPDPVLVSAFTKLDSIEYLIGSFLENLSCLLDSL